jgi:hypothetical protein
MMGEPMRGGLVTTEHAGWPEHQHEAVGHEHPHYHLTHNFIERVGGFEHLGYQHTHEHTHAAESHNHYPHEDFATEHLGEAHEHEHAPGGQVPASTAAKVIKKAAKKAADTPRKATPGKRTTRTTQQ